MPKQQPATPESHPGSDAYDATPRDGPAVFLADADALDNGHLQGHWIRTDRLDADMSAEELGRYVIWDQIGCGPTLVDQLPWIEDSPDLAETSPSTTPLERSARDLDHDGVLIPESGP